VLLPRLEDANCGPQALSLLRSGTRRGSESCWL